MNLLDFAYIIPFTLYVIFFAFSHDEPVNSNRTKSKGGEHTPPSDY